MGSTGGARRAVQAVAVALFAALSGCQSPTHPDLEAARAGQVCDGPSPFGRVVVGFAAGTVGALSWALDAVLQPASATPASPPLDLAFAVCDPGAFFRDGSRVVLVADPALDAPRVVAGVTVPPGVAWVGASPSFDGAVVAGQMLRLEGTARAVVPGAHVLRGWAELLGPMSGNGSRAAPAEYAGVRGGPAAGERFVPQCHLGECPEPSVSVALSSEATAEPVDRIDRVARVHATVACDRPVQVRLMFYTGATLQEGWREWTIDMRPHEPRSFGATVELPHAWLRGDYGGHYVVAVYAYAHPGASSRVASDTLQYTVEEGNVVVRNVSA